VGYLLKKILLVFLILVYSINFVCAQAFSDSNKILKILTYNIYHGETMNHDFDLDKIAKVILDEDPDIVALQEVDFKTNRVKKIDLVTELGIRTNMIPLFGRAMYFDGGEYGEGILSKYTFIQTRNIDLPYTEGNEPRAALEIITVLPFGDTIAFVGTHLDHLSDVKDRVLQVKKINKEVLINKYPTILAGDLNAIPDSKPINILDKHWASCFDKKQIEYTFPSNNPDKKIDYVLYYPKNKWEVISTKVICDKIASDHCAYLVTLRLVH